MKILRIIYEWPPPWHGLAAHPYELTLSQVKLGHTFDIFCGRWPKAGPLETFGGIRLVPFWREPLEGTLMLTTSVIMFFKYLAWRDEDENNVALIHSHGHFAIWIYLWRYVLSKIWKGAEELKTPLIVHFHNTVAGRKEALEEKNSPVKSLSKNFVWPLAEFSDKMAVKTASALIFVSEENKNDAIRLYNADPEKCYVVETGVNIHTFTPVPIDELDKTRSELNLDRLDKVILYHGVILERKNPHLIIQALKFLPTQYKLLLVGPGEPEYLNKLNDMIEELGLKHRVIRVGYTPYPQTPIAFQASDIFVLPSTFEGFPKVVMQSLATCVPALVSGFKSKEEIKGLYYLEDLSPENIASQIKEVIEKNEEVDISRISSHYSWDIKARQVEEVYKKVLGDKYQQA